MSSVRNLNLLSEPEVTPLTRDGPEWKLVQDLRNVQGVQMKGYRPESRQHSA